MRLSDTFRQSLAEIGLGWLADEAPVTNTCPHRRYMTKTPEGVKWGGATAFVAMNGLHVCSMCSDSHIPDLDLDDDDIHYCLTCGRTATPKEVEAYLHRTGDTNA